MKGGERMNEKDQSGYTGSGNGKVIMKVAIKLPKCKVKKPIRILKGVYVKEVANGELTARMKTEGRSQMLFPIFRAMFPGYRIINHKTASCKIFMPKSKWDGAVEILLNLKAARVTDMVTSVTTVQAAGETAWLKGVFKAMYGGENILWPEG